MMKSRFSTVIFDLGDVLFTWSASTPQSPLPPKVTKGILRSAHWFEYEKGNLSEDQAYAAAAEEFILEFMCKSRPSTIVYDVETGTALQAPSHSLTILLAWQALSINTACSLGLLQVYQAQRASFK